MADIDNEESGLHKSSGWLNRQIKRNIVDQEFLLQEHRQLLGAFGSTSRDSFSANAPSSWPGPESAESTDADWQPHLELYLEAVSALPPEKTNENFERLKRLFHGIFPAQGQAIDQLLDPQEDTRSEQLLLGSDGENVDQLDQRVDDQTLRPIACGGQSFVLRVRLRQPNLLVALKLLRDVTPTQVELDRFQGEAEIQAGLDDDEFMRVLAFGRFRGYQAIMMRWIDGPTLEDLIDDPRWTVRHSAEVTAELARIVAKAHKKAVLHRDLKPANIFVQLPPNLAIPFAPVESESEIVHSTAVPTLSGEAPTGDFQPRRARFPDEFENLPHLFATSADRQRAAARYASHLFETPVRTWRLCVSDFGLAIDLSDPETTRRTQAGTLLGTPDYMAPEQAHGLLRATDQSDLWSLVPCPN